MGDFEEVEQLQAGIRDWLLRAARSGHRELRDLPASAVLPLVCAAAFAPALTDGAGRQPASAAPASGVAGLRVLSSVQADSLAAVLAQAAERAQAGQPSGEMSRQATEREIASQIAQVLTGPKPHAAGLRSDIAMVLREIDVGGTLLRAAIEAGQEDLEHDVLAAAEAVSAEFGDMAFMLADLARAAGEIQDSLGSQGAELRSARGQVERQAADVRMIREELALVEQRSSRQWLPESADLGADPRWADQSPYRGLLPYDQAHEAVFFGRERLTAELAGQLAETGIVVVTGAAGAGKTSLLRAGLVPALARGIQVPGSPSWPLVVLTPGSRPLTDLASGLAALDDPSVVSQDPAGIRSRLAEAPHEAHRVIADHLGDARRMVLIIDQFEQVFTGDDEAAGLERAAFVDAVCAAATTPAGTFGEPPAWVVIAVRADHADRCAAYPRLLEAMQTGQLIVGPMPEAALRRVVTGPAESGGLRAGQALADAILADVRAAGREETAAILPFVSVALALTWRNRDGSRMSTDSYQRAGLRGQITRAIEVSAEATYTGLTEDQQELARDIFRRLTTVDRAGQPARRPATMAELRTGLSRGRQQQVGAVLDAFAGNQLVIVDGDRAEIAHEVALRAWPRLAGWLAEDRASVVLYDQLAEDTSRWRAGGRDSAALYRGLQLAAARQAARVWAGDPDRYPALSPGQADFLRASGRVVSRGRWLRRALSALLILLVIAALAGAGIAVRSARKTASQQRTAEASDQLAAQSTALAGTNPAMAALLAGAAWRIAPTAQARYSLLESLAQPVRGTLAASAGEVTALAYSPSGGTLAAGYADGTIRWWNLADHRLLASTTWRAAPLALRFTRGGRSLEVADADALGSWNLAGSAGVSTHVLAGAAAGQSAAFSPSGAILATGGDDGNVRLWNVGTGQEIGAPMSSDLRPVDAVAFNPDSSVLAAASTDGTVQLWDVASQSEDGATIAADSTTVKALAFSPDGTTLATGGNDGNVRLWNVASQAQTGTTIVTGTSVAALAFGADGTTLATAGSNGTTGLWNAATQKATGAALTAPTSGGLSALAFGSGSTSISGTLATGDGDGTVELWDPAGFHQAADPLATGQPEPRAANGQATAVISVGGQILAVRSPQGTVRLWNLASRRSLGDAIASQGPVTGLALSQDGQTLATSSDGLQLWATATGRQLGRTLPAADADGPVALSPDGSVVAAIGRDGILRLWRTSTLRSVGQLTTAGAASGLAVSPDDRIVATITRGGQVRLWSVATGRQVGRTMTAGPSGGTATVAFSPDGSMLATVDGGSVRLWDAATQQQIGTAMSASTQPVYAVAFSSGGSMLATAGGDGSVRLWDAATQQQIGPAMTAGTDAVYAVAFGSGDATLVATSADGTTRSWNVTFPSALLAGACAVAGGSLTHQQWAQYASGQPFRQVCPAG